MPTDDAAQKPCLIPGIPNDIAILCIARVPLRDQGPLRFVSKVWFDVFSKGEVYAVRKSLGLLQQFVIIFLHQKRHCDSEESHRSRVEIEFPVMMYDIESKLCRNLRPILYVGDPYRYPGHLKAISSGPDLYFVGDCENPTHRPNMPTHPMWILRGACGRWEYLEGMNEGFQCWIFANILDGQLFVADAPMMTDQEYVLSRNEDPWDLTMRRFDMKSTWTTLKVPSPPLQGYHIYDFRSVVKDNKLHCTSYLESWYVFNPKDETWEASNFNPNKRFHQIGDNFYTTTKGTLFGIFWDAEVPWEDPNDDPVHSRAMDHVGMQIMWYNESREEWVFLSKVASGVDNFDKYWTSTVFESLGDKLFVIEAGCGLNGSGVCLSILKLTFGENGITCEWELIKKIIDTNNQEVLSSSVMEL